MDGGDDPDRHEHVRSWLGRAQWGQHQPSAGGSAGDGIPGPERMRAGDPHGLFLSGIGGALFPRHRHGQVFQECPVCAGGQSGRCQARGRRQKRTAPLGICGWRQIHLRISGPHDEPCRPAAGRTGKSCGHALPSDQPPGHDLCAQPGRARIYPDALADGDGMCRRLPRWGERFAMDALRHQRDRGGDGQTDGDRPPGRLGATRRLWCGQEP